MDNMMCRRVPITAPGKAVHLEQGSRMSKLQQKLGSRAVQVQEGDPFKWVCDTVSDGVDLVASGFKATLSFFANMGCELGSGACSVGCFTGQAPVRIAAESLEAAVIALKATKAITDAVLSAVDSVLNNFAVEVELGGQLGTSGSGVSASFKLKVGPKTFAFTSTVDLSKASIESVIAGAWDKFKEVLKAQTSDIEKYF
eukprot:TRINITY_DN106_c0_g1_i5.p1 TRINITY_DN106_c0_g1~~TRINITY_DN106_c0_g1_i5.p1  ORF type:complete len:199 (-),score=70.57 TRINITY_DN106_c0_g1_i5:204-800(-)